VRDPSDTRKGGPVDKNLTSKIFGRLTVVSRAEYKISPSGYRTPKWICKCECGTTKEVRTSHLVSGSTTSCGCLQKKVASDVHKIHGAVNTPTYESWRSMRKRCDDPSHDSYPRYGGRGIIYCDRWKEFKFFLEDMGHRLENTTLDRIDTNGMYEKTNCRWATPKEQASNRNKPSPRKDRIMISHNGIIKSRKQWVEELGITSAGLKQRLKIMDIEKALSRGSHGGKKIV
jgi:hypothetical protein